MSVEQKILIVNAPKGAFSFQMIPEQYTPVYEKTVAWNCTVPSNTTLAMFFCKNSEDLSTATSFAGKNPDLAIIIMGEYSRFAAFAELNKFGYVPMQGTAEDFRRAEARAYNFVAQITKKTG